MKDVKLILHEVKKLGRVKEKARSVDEEGEEGISIGRSRRGRSDGTASR
jgi:hypothetical protein